MQTEFPVMRPRAWQDRTSVGGFVALPGFDWPGTEQPLTCTIRERGVFVEDWFEDSSSPFESARKECSTGETTRDPFL